MSSIFWYISVAVLGVGIGAITIYMKRNTYKISSFIVFYVFSACITWIGEFIALGVFNGYAYKTGYFTDPWAQNLTGHLLLNTTIYPGLACLMVGFSLGYGWIFLIVAFFIILEYLFVKLGIYTQHWWHYYMSVINIIVFLVISKKWFKKIIKVQPGVARTIVFFFICFFIIHLPFPIILLLKKEYYSVSFLNHLVKNLYRSSTIFILTYHLIQAFIFVYMVCVLKKWYWKLTTYPVAITGQFVLAKMHILIFLNGWNLYYSFLVMVTCLFIFILVEKFTLKPVEPRLGET